MSFEEPIWLVGLVAVPLLVALYLWRERRRAASAARFGNPALLPNVIDRKPGRGRWLALAVLLVALAALVVGVARPHAVVRVPREEATIVLAIDVSRSMKAKDIPPTRLGAARLAAKSFLRRIPERYRVGVVSFASRATVAVPPTEDRELVASALDSLRPGEGTAIGDAVVLAARLGRNQTAEDGSRPPRAVLVISDGARDGGNTTPQSAAAQARRLGVPVYTVVLGTQAGVVEEELTGGLTRIIRVPPSPETLQQIARDTRAEFFTAATAEGLSAVYERLGSQLGHREEEREVTDVFAGGSALLLLAGGALSAFWYRRVVP